MAVLLACCFALPAHATDSQVKVLVGDVCPNIAGNQPELPTGMQFDQNGDCYTPTPPTPPDTCPNLSGTQSAIPAGYYRNRAGNCVTQTKPPQDVCPNIDSIQSEVPYGMQNTADGSCVWPLADVCPNIAGPQQTMPKGMSYDAVGNCLTPATVTPPSKQKPPLSFVTPEMNLLPYYLIIPLSFIILLLLLQTIRESFATKRMIIFYVQKKKDTENKDQFILRIIERTTEVINAMNTLLGSNATDTTKPLLVAVQQLETHFSSIASYKTPDELADHDDFTHKGIHIKTLSSPLFWAPSILTITGVVVANIWLNTSAPIAFGALHLWLQAILLLISTSLLFLVLRSRHIRHIQHQHVEQLIKQTATLNGTQDDVIHQLHIVLDVGLQDIGELRNASDSVDRAFWTRCDELTALNEELRRALPGENVGNNSATEG